MKDFIFTALFILGLFGPYIFLFVLRKIDERKGIRMRSLNQEMMQLCIDTDYEFFEEAIIDWCEYHHKKIVDGKIVDA